MAASSPMTDIRTKPTGLACLGGEVVALVGQRLLDGQLLYRPTAGEARARSRSGRSVVPVPPLVRRRLGVILGQVLPGFLAAVRSR
jgi:hypothetical protein